MLRNNNNNNQDHGIQPHYFMANRLENVEIVTDFLFLGSKSLQMVTAAMKSKDNWFSAGKL